MYTYISLVQNIHCHRNTNGEWRCPQKEGQNVKTKVKIKGQLYFYLED